MKLKGKIIDFLGDSITEGACVADMSKRYDNRLKEMLDLKAVYNYGIGGSRLAHQRTPSNNPRFDLCFCGRAYDLNKDADVIVVFGGVNDYLHGDAPFGAYTDTTPATFCGAVHFLMNFLKNTYTEKKIVFMTPAHVCHDGISDKQVFEREVKNEDARPLKEYVDMIEKAGREHGIPVLNLFNKLGIDANIDEQRLRYTADGLHLNDEGHGVLAQTLAEFLKAL